MAGISMQGARRVRRMVTGLVLILATALVSVAQANTIVRISTTYGDFSVELFDTVAPATVQNFLNYVNRGAYNGTHFHRLDVGFVLQGGGYRFQPFVGPVAIPADPPVINEFSVSNTRGTLAMAKVGGDPNSATSQWFVNLADNSANLDTQNSGFTVFGRVLGDGMVVVDKINSSVGVYSLGSLYEQAPLRDYAFDVVRAANFVTMNIEVVQRHSAALTLFESQSGLLMTSVDGGDALGAYSLNLSLQNLPGIVFRLNVDSLVPLAARTTGMATFSTTDNRLRIPSMELNFNGDVSILNNVVLVVTDPVNSLFTLESYQQ